MKRLCYQLQDEEKPYFDVSGTGLSKIEVEFFADKDDFTYPGFVGGYVTYKPGE